jgi:8-oxo-dGTP diphosphatase
MNIKYPPKKKKCESGYFINRGTSVDAVIRNSKGEFLLGKRNIPPFKGMWGNIGGYVEWDEKVEEALEREVKEEIGLKIENYSFINCYSNPRRHPKQVITFAFLIEINRPVKLKIDKNELSEVAFFKYENLPKLAFDHSKIIADVIAMKNGHK